MRGVRADETILLVANNPNDEVLTRRTSKKNNVVHDGVEALVYLLCTGAYEKCDTSNMQKFVLLDLEPETGV